MSKKIENTLYNLDEYNSKSRKFIGTPYEIEDQKLHLRIHLLERKIVEIIDHINEHEEKRASHVGDMDVFDNPYIDAVYDAVRPRFVEEQKQEGKEIDIIIEFDVINDAYNVRSPMLWKDKKDANKEREYIKHAIEYYKRYKGYVDFIDSDNPNL